MTVVILEVMSTRVLVMPSQTLSQPSRQRPSGWPTRKRMYDENNAPNNMTSEARNSQIPALALYKPVSGRAATVYGISMSDRVKLFPVRSARCNHADDPARCTRTVRGGPLVYGR